MTDDRTPEVGAGDGLAEVLAAHTFPGELNHIFGEAWILCPCGERLDLTVNDGKVSPVEARRVHAEHLAAILRDRAGDGLSEAEREALRDWWDSEQEGDSAGTMLANLDAVVLRIIRDRASVGAAGERAKPSRRRRCGCGWCCADVPPEKRGEAHKRTCFPRIESGA